MQDGLKIYVEIVENFRNIVYVFFYIALPLFIDSSFLIVNVKVGAVNTVKKSHKSITCAVLRYLTKYFLLRCRCDALFVGRNLI